MGLGESKDDSQNDDEQNQNNNGPMVLLHVYNLSPEYNRIAGTVGMVRSHFITSSDVRIHSRRSNSGSLSYGSRNCRTGVLLQYGGNIGRITQTLSCGCNVSQSNRNGTHLEERSFHYPKYEISFSSRFLRYFNKKL